MELVVSSNLQFLEIDIKQLPKELKYTFLIEEKTAGVNILFGLDDDQEGKLTRLLW